MEPVVITEHHQGAIEKATAAKPEITELPKTNIKSQHSNTNMYFFNIACGVIVLGIAGFAISYFFK